MVDGIADVIMQFVGILLEIVELIAVVVVYPVDKFVAYGPHRFVRHANEPGHGALALYRKAACLSWITAHGFDRGNNSPHVVPLTAANRAPPGHRPQA